MSNSLDSFRGLALKSPKARNAVLLASVREIYNRSASQLPVDKDLPRLVGKIRILRPDGDYITFHNENDSNDGQKSTTMAAAVERMLTCLSELLDSEDVHAKMKASCQEHLQIETKEGTRVATALKAMLGDPQWNKLDTPALSVVRALNQSIVAPPWSMLKLGFGEEVPFVNIPNSWQIEIHLPEHTRQHVVTVTHTMAQRVPQDEAPEKDALLFKWQLALDIDVRSAQLVAVRFDLTDLELNPDVPLARARQFQQALIKYSLNNTGMSHPEGSLNSMKGWLHHAKQAVTERTPRANLALAAEVICAVGALYMAMELSGMRQ